MILHDVWPEPFEPGVFFNMPETEYFQPRPEVASASGLRPLIQKTPAHYHYASTHPSEPTPAMVLGSAYHCAVLEPDLFEDRYVVVPEDAPRKPSKTQREAKKPSAETIDAIAFWDEFEATGKIILSAADHDRLRFMGEAVHKHPEASGLLTVPGYNEVTMTYVDRETGVQCKLRTDRWVPAEDILVDLKTTVDAAEEAFARSVASYLYHVQHAHYIEGVASLAESFPGGWSVSGAWDDTVPLRPAKHFMHVVQEKEPPFVVAVRFVDAASEQRGFELRHEALKRLDQCLKSGEWPGYPGITSVMLPPWAMYTSKGEQYGA